MRISYEIGGLSEADFVGADPLAIWDKWFQEAVAEKVGGHLVFISDKTPILVHPGRSALSRTPSAWPRWINKAVPLCVWCCSKGESKWSVPSPVLRDCYFEHYHLPFL